MSRYKAYSEYKDSGVEWLDQVPFHWTSVPIKYMALDKNSMFVDGDWIESKDISGDEIRYITTGNVGEGVYKEQGEGFISTEKFIELNCTEVFADDILISRLNNPIGRSCIVPDLRSRVVTSVDNVIFRPDKHYTKKYLVYLFSSPSYFEHTANLARGATMQRISRGLLGNIRVVVPTISEQDSIAAFLDHETAKIDALIEKQRRLIDLLKEKRQAVISHAVTKGLNPKAPVKDSGVEWLGEVPAHWGISSLGFECNVKARLGWKGLKAEEYVDDGYIFLATPNIKEAFIDFENVNYITKERYDESPEIMLEVGDVLVTKDGSTTGTTNLVRGLPRPATVNSSIAVLRSYGRLESKFLYYFFISSLIQNVIKMMQGGMGVPHLFQADLRKFMVLMPPHGEQLEIAEKIEARLPKFALLIEKAEVQIELLQERRTALISAAVTGKIDVRDWQAAA